MGAMFTFARSVDGVWAQQGPAVFPDAVNFASRQVGRSVAVDRAGLTAILGDPNDFSEAWQGGAAWVVSRASRGSTWGVPQRLVPGVTFQYAAFGSSVAMNDAGTTAVVGAPFFDLSASITASSAWYRFDRNPTTGVWSLASGGGGGYASPGTFASVPTAPLNFRSTLQGMSLGLSADGGVVVVGRPLRANATGVETGAAEVWACGVA